jgi:hypothetical protein
MKIYHIMNIIKLVRHKNIDIFFYKLGQIIDSLT